MNPTQENRQAEIITPLGKDKLLLSNMHINEELGRLFSIETELISKKDNIKFEDLLGKSTTIRLNLSNGEPRFFNGHITRFSQIEHGDTTGGVYQATIQPWLWFLTRTSDCKIFQKKTVPDIIKEIFSDWGHPFEAKLQRNYREWDYCVQYRETDFNFVSRLMEQEGIYYFFKHEDGIHTLILTDDSGAHKRIYAGKKDRVPLFPDDNQVRDEEYCSSWLLSKSILPGTYALNDYDFERPTANLEVSNNLIKPHSVGDQEIYDYPGEYIQIDDGDQYSKNRIEELHSQYETVQSGSDVRDMKTGGLFTLAEHPRKDQNKEYLIVSVNHSFQNNDYGARPGSEGVQYNNNLTAIDSSVPFRTSQITPKPIVQGPQTAIVVGPGSEEIYTDDDGYGMVKVQFHWDRYGEKDENSSCWMRVSQLWAGKNWGGIHIPRIGQEVIVDFIEGDPDHPIITGRVYNADQMPPYDLPANKTQSGIKSRSSKGGTPANFNEIRMEDKKGQEELYIHAEKNHTNITENDRSEDVGHDRSLHVGHDKSETVDNNKTIDIGVNHTENIGSNMEINVGNNLTEAIANNMNQSVGNNSDTSVGVNYSLSVGAKAEMVAKAKMTLTVGISTIEMTPGSIKISCGASKIELTPASVAVTAPIVSLNG